MEKKKNAERQKIGWREWVALPELNIPKVKAKIDTGARTSSLHAFDLKPYTRDGVDYVSFQVAPVQRSSKRVVKCKAEVSDYRKVKSSNGMTEWRPVILTDLKLGDVVFEAEVTLTNRDEMGFRMLLGRQSLKRYLIDPGKSYLTGASKTMVKKKKTDKSKKS